jgi:hypothetical protein
MISRIIENILTHSKDTKSLIAIRKNNEESSLWIGYILDFNEHIFILQHISSLGFEDGIVIEKMESIDNFEIDETTIKSIQILYQQNQKLLIQEIRDVKITTEENWQSDIIQNSFHQGKLIMIEINDADSVTYGFVIDFDETIVQIISIDSLGAEIGTQTYKLADITSIGIDRIECRKRELLFECNTSKNSNRK